MEAIAPDEEEKQADCRGKNETGRKKQSLLATAVGLVVDEADEKHNGLVLCDEEGVDYLGCEQDKEEKSRRLENHLLANFFRPVQRQIVEIIKDVS